MTTKTGKRMVSTGFLNLKNNCMLKKCWKKLRIFIRNGLKDKLIMRALHLLFILLEIVKNCQDLHH